MLEVFTGITMACTMRQNWNNESFDKINYLFVKVIGCGAVIAIKRAWTTVAFLDVDGGEYVANFTLHCDVSSDVEKEKERCQRLVEVLKKFVFVNETFCVEAYLNGNNLTRVMEKAGDE